MAVRLRPRTFQAVGHVSALCCPPSPSGARSCGGYVHEIGPRTNGPFLAMSARALREDDAVAVLAGNGSGDSGLLQQARGGTLYLGDIEGLPEPARRWLSGVLESGTLRVPGNAEPVPLDVRLISTALPGADVRVGAVGVGRDLYAHLAALPL